METETTKPHENDIITFTEEQIDRCSFDRWYPQFSEVSIKSKFVKLKEEFVNWLHSDGLHFGDGLISRPDELDRFDACEPEWSEEEASDEKSEESLESSPPNFPELEEFITQTIKEFDGAVFPKLNWSSPKDATWMMTSSNLKCQRPEDVFLVMKSSNFVAHDLDLAYEKCYPKSNKNRPEEFVLVLRKWYDMKPSLEFRCFVKDSNLIGISQRDDGSFYPFLVSSREELKGRIVQFFKEKIQNRFEDKDYCFDVYVHSQTKRVYLVDFNPFGEVTDGLLFEWEELHLWNWKQEKPLEFRIVESKEGIKPLSSDNRVPFDLIDRSSGSALSDLIENLKKDGNYQK